MAKPPLISPTIAAELVTSLPGFEAHQGYCQGAERFMKIARQQIEDIHATKEVVSRDRTQTPEARAMMIGQKADKLERHLFEQWTSKIDALEKAAAFIRSELARPLEARANTTQTNTEVRAYCKSLTIDEREKFLNEAMGDNDLTTLGAVLGSPPYLSGLSKEQQQFYTTKYNQLTNPQLQERLDLLETIQKRIQPVFNIVKDELWKTAGLNRDHLQALQDGSKAAKDAIIVKDFSESN